MEKRTFSSNESNEARFDCRVQKKCAKRKYFMNTRVAGFQYHEGLLCYEKLKVGRKLTMQRELGNTYDQNAVALYCGEYLVGYLPKSDNEKIALLLELGWTDLFEVRIDKVDESAHPEHRLGITIFVRAKEERK